MYVRVSILAIAVAVLATPCAVRSATPQTANSDAGEVKWHPGHYLFVQSSELREEHIHKGFRGVQKTYSWRALEPEKDRYDFSAIRSDLAFLGKHGKRLVVQVQTKTFGVGQNYCPAYLSAPEYGGGVYGTRWGSFNPLIWNEAVNWRLNALYARLGKKLDKEPQLEAVVIPESATTFDPVQRDALGYTSNKYARSVEDGMQAMKTAFPTTVVIQYVNMPPDVIKPLADYAKAHGIGFGGPDVYPYDPVLNNPQHGVYRLYAPLSGVVPLGAAVQWNDYTQTASFRGAAGETPVKEIYEFGRDKLKLNYMFWGNRPGYIEKVREMMESPSFPQDPAGGLNAARPTVFDNKGKATEVTVVPARDDSMLLNPGKGWVQYYGSDKYTNDYISVGYTRWAWSVLEPKEGEFNWKEIDGFIKQFKRYDKKTAFGVMSISTGLGQYVTPKWVFDAGAASVAVTDSSSPTGRQIIPKTWDDPVFLRKLKAFVAALGQRYDGNPDIAFIDIRSYGNWGEGHIGMLDAPGIVLTPPDNLKRNYFLPYIQAFPDTQLIVPWGSGMYDAVYDWAVRQGAGMRRDGILSKWSKDGSECLRAHGRHPSVFEYCDGYDEMKKNGWWKPNMLRDIYFASGKPSYMQWNPRIFEENRDFCLKLGNYVGYHFVLQEAVLPKSFRSSDPLRIRWRWLNDGIAYLYEPCYAAIALLDRNDKIVQRQWLGGSSPKSWAPGQSTTETVDVGFTSLPAGTYKLAVGLFLKQADAHPAYRLGIQGRTSEGWYVLYDRLECK